MRHARPQRGRIVHALPEHSGTAHCGFKPKPVGRDQRVRWYIVGTALTCKKCVEATTRQIPWPFPTRGVIDGGLAK